MKHTSFITAAAFLVALAFSVSPAAAQSRGHAASRAPSSAGRAVGTAAPRVGPAPRIVTRGRVGVLPYRAYPGFYGYRAGLGLGLYAAYGYPFGYYGYGAYPYGFGYPYWYAGYGSLGYDGYYGYPAYAGSAGYGAGAYGSVRIESSNRDAQVFADGYYVGVVDDFDGTFQHLNLEAGAHRIEIRSLNTPPISFDVNVQPGQTITYRADPRR